MCVPQSLAASHPHLGDVLPIDADAAAPHVVEAEEQADDGALPRARRSHLHAKVKGLEDTRDSVLLEARG